MNQDQYGYSNPTSYNANKHTTNTTTGVRQQAYQNLPPPNFNSAMFTQGIHQQLPSLQQGMPFAYQTQGVPNHQYKPLQTHDHQFHPRAPVGEGWPGLTGGFPSPSLRRDESHSYTKTLNNDVKLLERSTAPQSSPRTAARSNKGCLTCKSRKHKCDEVKPICNECARINMMCIYAPKGFVNLEGVATDMVNSTGGALVQPRKVQANVMYVEGIGSVKILRAKVDRKVLNGKVVYRA